MAGNSLESGRSVTSKVVAILLTFANGEAHTLTEVARLAGIPTSTAHRLIGELTSCGALEKTDGSHYRVAAPLQEACLRSSRAPRGAERVSGAMEDLSIVTHAPVRFGVLAENRVAYREKAVNRPATQLSDGATAPVHATAMGKAILAFSSPTTFDAIIEAGLSGYTAQTITNADDLRKALAAVRLSRFAVCRGEWAAGVTTMAAPVFGPGGRVVGALEVTLRDLTSDLRTFHPVLVIAARSLSRDLAGSSRMERLASVPSPCPPEPMSSLRRPVRQRQAAHL